MSVFKDFPGLENLEKKFRTFKDFQGLSRTRKSPDYRYGTGGHYRYQADATCVLNRWQHFSV